ncbi:OmpA family protein [Thiospirillum jenense]|uniref:OmpA family protein n=1 Tax=Thiospirillum jenense TaxID=1653858 RepID=A0A839HHA9_9GAMM|nr:OmpA family protein [Thiospirillum jenense]MBB1125612.1 OmpA family protein [Thiospirillum jenense]
MLHVRSLTRAAGLISTAALALTLVAAPAFAADHDESYWYATGDRSLPDGQLWVNSAGECWQSAYPDGPNDLPPCGVEKPAEVAEVPEEFTVRLNFAFDKDEMRDVVNRDEVARLDDYIANVKATTTLEYLTVIGHTDAVGSDAYNERLGMRRAVTVRNYLIAQGLAEEQIAAPQSMGERKMLPSYPPDALEQRRVRIMSRAD